MEAASVGGSTIGPPGAVWAAAEAASAKTTSKVERAMGIEPTSKAWEALVLPLNYARVRRSSANIIQIHRGRCCRLSLRIVPRLEFDEQGVAVGIAEIAE